MKHTILIIAMAFGMLANAQQEAIEELLTDIYTITADNIINTPYEGTGLVLYNGSDSYSWDGDCGGYCESYKEVGSWQDAKEQFVLSIGHDEHQWAYDKKVEPQSFGVYACMCCCSIPDYTISQKRVCGICGWVQEQITFVGHNWVTYPKTEYEKIIDSLKNK